MSDRPPVPPRTTRSHTAASGSLPPAPQPATAAVIERELTRPADFDFELDDPSYIKKTYLAYLTSWQNHWGTLSGRKYCHCILYSSVASP